MNTLEDLRALLEEISRTAEPDANIDIRLPPVTYEGELVLNRLAVNLTSSVVQAGRRTAFTGPVHLTYSGGAISYFDGIDFTGDGEGTGGRPVPPSPDELPPLRVEYCRFLFGARVGQRGPVHLLGQRRGPSHQQCGTQPLGQPV